MNFLKKAAAYDATAKAFAAAGVANLTELIAQHGSEPAAFAEALINALGETVPAADTEGLVALADLTAEHPAVTPLIAAAIDGHHQLLATALADAGLKIDAAKISDPQNIKAAIADRSSTLAAELLAQRGFAPGSELDDTPPADATKPGAKGNLRMTITEFKAMGHNERMAFVRRGGRCIDSE